MHLQVVVFGRTAESFFCESEQHYLRRIAPFAKVEWKELKAEKIVSNTSPENIKEAEAKRFFEIFPERNYLIVCDVQGKQFSSEDFAKKLEQIRQTHSGITLVIGGALGLSKSILEKANLRLSLSLATFPHDLFRTMLLEQVYRAFMIIGNREYHK